MAEGGLIPVGCTYIVVHKRDGDIRIHEDFKLTVNPVLCLQVYPLPTPEGNREQPTSANN